MEKYAYIRVSTREQNEARQLIAMLAQVKRENIFCDKQSGGDFERAAYQALKARLRRAGPRLCAGGGSRRAGK